MSKEIIENFFTKVSEDEPLQKALIKIYADGVNAVGHAATVDLASGHGFEFTAEELAEVWAAQHGELSDEQLDAVAGGSCALPSSNWSICCCGCSSGGSSGNTGGGGSSSSSGGGGWTSSSRA